MKDFIKKFTPSFLLSWYHLILAFFGALFYGFPSRKLKVIGITGTKGKSTVVELASKILETAGYKTAFISSIRFKIADRERKNELKMTMPGRLKIQRFLNKAVKNGCQYAILEVTSEGILQHRQKFIDFDIVVFTNLSPEHIERHGSFEKYRETKGKLFRSCKKVHIINLDDKNAEYFLQFKAEEKITYGIRNKEAGIRAEGIKLGEGNVSFLIHNSLFEIRLPGEFNLYNALAAICSGLSQGVDLEVCKRALEKIKLMPGRMEIIISNPFKVIVDYAHTPDSLEKVYQTLQATSDKKQATRMICVLGSCGGGRDKWKRPVLGQIAAKNCNEVIITNEDPYDENPMEIIEQVAEGALKEIRLNPRHCPCKSASIYKILERKEAIGKALQSAKSNDVVVITGKGSESWMCIERGKKNPWDDREVVREQLRKLKTES